MTKIENLIGNYTAFFLDLVARTTHAGIDIRGLPVSHMCYRTVTMTEYEGRREQLKAFSRAYDEYLFNERPVAIFLLKRPLKLSPNHSLSIIELPSPRPVHMYPSGLEHVGLTVGKGFKTFKEIYNGVVSGEKDHGEYCKPLFLTFDNGKTIKFYEYSLEEVIKREGRKFIPLYKQSKTF